MPRIFRDEDLIPWNLEITELSTNNSNAPSSGYGIIRKDDQEYFCYFTRVTDKRRLICDMMKEIFGLESMSYAPIMRYGKEYLISVCSKDDDLCLSDFTKEDFGEEELSKIRGVYFFRRMIGMLRNSEKSVIVRVDENNELIFISRDDRVQTINAICGGVIARLSQKTSSKWINSDEIRECIHDVPIWKGKTKEEISDSFSDVLSQIIDLINSIDENLLYMFEPIHEFIISCI